MSHRFIAIILVATLLGCTNEPTTVKPLGQEPTAVPDKKPVEMTELAPTPVVEPVASNEEVTAIKEAAIEPASVVEVVTEEEPAATKETEAAPVEEPAPADEESAAIEETAPIDEKATATAELSEPVRLETPTYTVTTDTPYYSSSTQKQAGTLKPGSKVKLIWAYGLAGNGAYWRVEHEDGTRSYVAGQGMKQTKATQPDEKAVQEEEQPFTYIVVTDAEYYRKPPWKGNPPDGKLKAGTKVTVWNEGSGYFVMQDDDGQQSYAAIKNFRSPTPLDESKGSFQDAVTIKFSEEPYSFSLEEVAKGVELNYQIVVKRDCPGVIPTGHNCWQGPSGLYQLQRISGSGQLYHLRDFGPCPPMPRFRKTIRKGLYSCCFPWDGRNWTGPSDVGTPKGPPFPAGTYTFEVGVKGELDTLEGRKPYNISKSVKVVLTP